MKSKRRNVMNTTVIERESGLEVRGVAAPQNLGTAEGITAAARDAEAVDEALAKQIEEIERSFSIRWEW
jgi:hypothetical protein